MKETSRFHGALLAACLAAFPVAPAHAAQAEPEGYLDSTLAGVYELAVENDYTIAQARAEYRAGQEERRLARAGLLPQLQGGFTYAESESESRASFAIGDQIIENANDTDTDQEEWDVSLVQPVFDAPAWFRFQQGVKLSEQSAASFAAAQQDLILRTVRSYFGVLRVAANLKASQAQESALKAQLDQVRQRFDVGMVAITDVHEAQAGYDLAVAQRLADEGSLGSALELLSVLTGRSHGELWVLEEEFPVVTPEPADSAAWVAFALENNFDIKAARLAREAARKGSRAAASEHLPTVDLALSYTDTNQDVTRTDLGSGITTSFPNDQEFGVVSLNVTLPLYTGGFTSANRRQAAARYEAQLAGYEGTVRTVTQETRASHIQVLSDVARTRARAQAVTSTRSALEAAEVGYDVGTRNVVDVLQAQQAYFSAVRDYENSIIDYVVDLAVLKRLSGTLSPEDVYELNQWLAKPPEPTLSGTSSRRPAGGDGS